MLGLWTTFKKLFLRLILLSVGLNVVVSTIPRCDLVLSVIHKVINPQVDEHSDHCANHEKMLGYSKVLKQQNVCACALAKFMFAHLSRIQVDPIITRQNQALSTIVFSYDFSTLNLSIPLETPPPRFS